MGRLWIGLVGSLLALLWSLVGCGESADGGGAAAGQAGVAPGGAGGSGGCVPTSCVAEGRDCGTIADGCGELLECGTCTGLEICGGSGHDNVCGAPPDGCGDGDCALDETCANCPDDCCAGPFRYVDAVHGTDEGNELGSEEEPWRTLAWAKPRLEPGDTLYLRAGIYEGPLELDADSSGEEGRYITYAAYPGEAAVIDGSGLSFAWHGLVDIAEASYLKVTGLEVRRSPSFCFFVRNGAHHVLIDRNVIHDCLDSGVSLYGHEHPTRISAVVVADNELYELNSSGSQEGISAAGADDFVIKNNHLYALYKEGIDAKSGCVGGVIRGNHVHGCNLGPSARPGIYVDAYASPQSDILVDGNRVHDCGEGFAFATEQGGTLTNITFANNVAYGNVNGMGCHSYIQAGDTPEMHVKSNVVIVNNTFASNTAQGLQLLELPEKLPGFVIRNNIVASSPSLVNVIDELTEADVTMDHNLLYDGYIKLHGEPYLNADPRFVDPGGRDFHLQAGSPAIDAGSEELAPLTDFDGLTRAAGAIDLGCYERSP